MYAAYIKCAHTFIIPFWNAVRGAQEQYLGGVLLVLRQDLRRMRQSNASKMG